MCEVINAMMMLVPFKCYPTMKEIPIILCSGICYVICSMKLTLNKFNDLLIWYVLEMSSSDERMMLWMRGKMSPCWCCWVGNSLKCCLDPSSASSWVPLLATISCRCDIHHIQYRYDINQVHQWVECHIKSAKWFQQIQGTGFVKKSKL